jgi:hypothetical protein
MNRGCGCSGGDSYDYVSGGCETNDTILQIIVVLLLIYVLYRLSTEHYVGNGLGTPTGSIGAYTSGATLRRLGQHFSSTNQGVPMTLYNADLPGDTKTISVSVFPLNNENN